MKDMKLNELLKIDEKNYENWSLFFNNANYENVNYSFEQEGRLLEHISWKKTNDHKRSFRIMDTPCCLQFLRLDKEGKKDEWLFLGAFEKNGLEKKKNGDEVYMLEELDDFKQYKEKLIVRFKKEQGPKQAKINAKEVENLDVVDILDLPYFRVRRSA